MQTDKKTYTFNLDTDTFNFIQDYKFNKRLDNRSLALREIIKEYQEQKIMINKLHIKNQEFIKELSKRNK